MSGIPPRLVEDPHLSGTTWAGFGLAFKEDGVALDLAGADARMVFRDASGSIVFDWHLSDPTKPGLAIQEPASGVLYVQGPGVLAAAAGTLVWDLKLWLGTGEVTVDLQGVLPIVAGVTP